MPDVRYTTLMCLGVRGGDREEAGQAAARVYQDLVGILHRAAPSVRELRLEVDEPVAHPDLPGSFICWSRLQATVPQDFRTETEENQRDAWRMVVRRVFLHNLRRHHGLVDGIPSRVELTREILPWESEKAPSEAPAAVEEPKELIPVRVLLGGTEYRVEIPKGENLLDGVNDRGVKVRWDCKSGVCDTCKIRVLKGMENLTPPTEAEESMLGDLLAKGYRLCCQVTANGPCEIEQ